MPKARKKNRNRKASVPKPSPTPATPESTSRIKTTVITAGATSDEPSHKLVESRVELAKTADNTSVKVMMSLEDPSAMVLECAERDLLELLMNIVQSENIPMHILEQALFTASEMGHLRVVCFLVKYASIACVNDQGETALALGARNGHLEVPLIFI